VGQTRAQRFEAVGLEKLSPEQKLVMQPLIRAMAAMLDEATKPKEKKVKDPLAGQDWKHGKRALDNLASWAPGAVAWSPVQAGTVLALGKAVRQLGLDDNDMAILAGWLDTGGLSWMKEKPTTSYIARNLADLVAKSRAALPREMRSALDRVRER
jgi:hypothetical protein